MAMRRPMFRILATGLVSLLLGAAPAAAQGPAGCLAGDCGNGTGVQRLEDGVVYKGTFVEGRWHGRGTLTSPAGDSFSGEFRQGAATGYAVIRLVDGTRYEGDVVDGRFHGEGTLTFPSGAVYRGPLRQGFANGRGVMSFPDGAYYEGEFRNGQRHGQGRFVAPNGTVAHAGAWRDNAPVHPAPPARRPAARSGGDLSGWTPKFGGPAELTPSQQRELARERALYNARLEQQQHRSDINRHLAPHGVTLQPCNGMNGNPHCR